MAMNDVPNHLIVGARTGFLSALETEDKQQWSAVAEEFNMDAKSQLLVDVGAAPMPSRNLGNPQVKAFIEKSKTITPLDWDITVGVSYNNVMDDQTGALLRHVKGAGANFNRHINQRVFQVLNGGDGTTYGLCYDGQNFFSASHADKGAEYSTAQTNTNALALSIDNFETILTNARLLKDDQGNYCNYNFDQLIVPPQLERTAYQILQNPAAYDTANREANPYAGRFKPAIVNPYMDSTAWILTASSESAKPLIVAMRQRPFLQNAWFDPKEPDGGMYFFKFYGRYEVHYADWRLAYMGNS